MKSEDALTGLLRGGSIVQLPIMLALVAYYRDPQFSMYTTNLRNVTSHEMDVEVEAFSASGLYLLTSAVTAGFSLASKKVTDDGIYTAEVLEEEAVWDLSFWTAVALQHVCLVTFMCSPLDWYFLTLTVTGIALMLMLLSRLPLAPGGRSRENVLLLLLAMLFLMLYSTVRQRHHGVFFAALVVLDSLMLVGHTFDTAPDMPTVGNCRLCHACGMSALVLASYLQ